MQSDGIAELRMCDVGEKLFLREYVLPRLQSQGALVGAGDDAAAIMADADTAVVASTDRIGENLTALQLGLMTFEELGRYAAVATMSDIVAMGVRPRCLLLSLGLPGDFRVTDALAIIHGAQAYCTAVSAELIGGDTKWSANLSVVGTAFGVAPPSDIVRRIGAADGDAVFVTGPVGAFAASLAYFLVAEPNGKVLPPDRREALRKCLCHPTLALPDASVLRRACCSVCMDTTDGAGDALHTLAAASGLSVEIVGDDLPLHPLVREVADLIGTDHVDLALGVGADFVLMGAVSPRNRQRLHEFIPSATVIGQFSGVGPSRVIHRGVGRPLPEFSFEQFRVRVAELVSTQLGQCQGASVAPTGGTDEDVRSGD